MLLYNSQVSGNCYKVRLVAAQLGLKLELRELEAYPAIGARVERVAAQPGHIAITE